MNFTAGGATGLPAFQPWTPGAVSVALVVAVISVVWFLQPSDDWAALPGPPPASKLLGHVPQMNVLNVHHFWQDCTQKYGAKGMFKVRLLHMRVVVISDPLLIQAVTSRAADLPKAFALYDTFDELAGPTGHRSFFNTHDDEEWRIVRKTTAPAFSPASIRRAFPKLMEVTAELCDVLAAKVEAGQSSIEMSEAAMRVTLDVIGSTGYGYDFNARSYAPCELFEIIPPVLGEFTLRATSPLRILAHKVFPFLPEARKFQKRVKACHKWWKILMDSVKQTDLAAAKAEGDTSLRVCLAQLPFSDELLMPQVAVYLVAGFETTAHSIAWSLYEIASHPAVQRRLEAELNSAGLLGPEARPFEFNDLAALPYLNCVLKEGLRLHPVASNGSIRKVVKEISLGGYRLAPGTLLWIPFIALLTSKHNWERADEFWPERWETEGQGAAVEGAASGPTPVGNASSPSLSYLPFSYGPRDCIGQNLALMEARAVIASIVGRFELAVAPEMGSREDVRNDEVMKLTLQTSRGIWLNLKLRS